MLTFEGDAPKRRAWDPDDEALHGDQAASKVACVRSIAARVHDAIDGTNNVVHIYMGCWPRFKP